MAVEARHLNLFPPPIIGNREMMNEANINFYNPAQMGYSSLLPLSGTTTATGGGAAAGTDALLPPAAYNSLVADSLPLKTPIKSESTLTYNNVPLSRKRSRENSINYPYPSSYPITTPIHNSSSKNSFTFLGEDLSLQIHQQQLDIDQLIAQQMEKVRVELEDKRKRQARRIMDAIEFGVMKRMRAKEDEIEKIGKLNWALEEKVKSLCIENQIWRDLAQTNEATANALRTNLEQVLSQRNGFPATEDDGATVFPAAVADDAESCCGSSDDCNDREEKKNATATVSGWRTVSPYVGAQDKDMECLGLDNGGGSCTRLCRNCGKGESCVLILPCRHLCLCTVCGSTLHTCPICKSFKTASVHVNMS